MNEPEEDFGKVDDGFGNVEIRCADDCGICVCRPGDFRCAQAEEQLECKGGWVFG